MELQALQELLNPADSKQDSGDCEVRRQHCVSHCSSMDDCRTWTQPPLHMPPLQQLARLLHATHEMEWEKQVKGEKYGRWKMSLSSSNTSMMTLDPSPSEPNVMFLTLSHAGLLCRYELVFRQSVGAEDVFLGMGGKSPATASCPYQIVSLYLSQSSVKCCLHFRYASLCQPHSCMRWSCV